MHAELLWRPSVHPTQMSHATNLTLNVLSNGSSSYPSCYSVNHRLPSADGTKAKHLKPIVKRRLDQHDAGDWKTLLEEYESDVVRSQLIHRVDTRTEDDKDIAVIRKAVLISCPDISNAAKLGNTCNQTIGEPY